MVHHELLIAQDRRAALVREFEQRRLARMAAGARPRHTRLHSRLLDRLGARLVAWGWQLRARYGNLDAVEYRRREA